VYKDTFTEDAVSGTPRVRWWRWFTQIFSMNEIAVFIFPLGCNRTSEQDRILVEYARKKSCEIYLNHVWGIRFFCIFFLAICFCSEWIIRGWEIYRKLLFYFPPKHALSEWLLEIFPVSDTQVSYRWLHLQPIISPLYKSIIIYINLFISQWLRFTTSFSTDYIQLYPIITFH